MDLKEAIEGWLNNIVSASCEKQAQQNSSIDDKDPAMPPGGRLLIDGKATRKSVFDTVKTAVEKRFPVENDNYRIELKDVKYEGPTEFTLEQQKQALLHNRRLGCSLAGTWRLIDKATGNVIEEKRDSVIRVPYYTNRGTIIHNGNEYTVISQARLSPGVYTRRKQNGDLESQFNVANGKGFRLELDKETGKIALRMGQANLPLYPVLKAFGITDQQIAKSWGTDIALTNSEKNDPRALQKLYEKVAGYKIDPLMTPQQQASYIKDELGKFGLDPATVARTLGIENVKGVTPEVLLRASQKLLNINRGVEEPDNRDNPRFSKFYGIEHMLGERIDKDSAKLLKPMLFRVGRDKSLARVSRNALGAYIDDFLSTSGLAQPGEEANPMSILVQQSRITRTGEGGISSPDLITPEARGVQGDYLGFVDFLAGPECMPKGCEVFTRSGWIKWEEASEDTEFACLIDGILEFHKPFKLHVHDYDGDLYCAAAKLISYRYTPNHKMYVNPCFHLKDGSLTKYRFEYAVDVSKKGRHVMTGGHGAFKGSEMPYFTLPEVAIGAPNQTRIKDIPIEDWAEFMGWYLSEGNTYIRKGKRPKDVHYSVIITQEKYFDALMQCVQRLPFRFNTKSHNGNPNGGIVISCKQLALYLSQFGKSADKFIPEYFFDAPVAVRKRLLYGLMMGDGRKKRDTWTYMTVSKRLARDVERLGFGLGYSVHLRFERDDRPQANHGGTYAVHFCKKNERELKKKDRWSSGNYYTEHYSGKVYCATVPGHLLFVRSDSSTMGHWTGNSSAAGVDVRGSYGTVIGSDHKLYNIFRNLRTGKKEYLSLDAAADKVIAFPDQDPKSPYMYCMRNGVPTRVKTSEVDYMVPSFSRTLGAGINMNPMPTAVFGMRSFYSSKFWEQYLPQKKGEVPMVDSLMPDGKMTFNEYYGRKAGCITAPFSGVVARVTNDSIVIKGKDGKTESFDLVTNLPHNRMSVTGDTEVFVKRNHKVFKIRIEDYSHNDGDEVLSYNPDTMSSAWMRITGFTRHDNIRKLLRVTYKSGRFIDVTEDHSLITLSDDFRFIPIYPKDCRPGVTKTPLVHGNINTDNRWTYDMGVLDGLYLSEGYVGMNSRREPAVCNIACLPLKRRQYIASILASLGYKVQPKSLTTTRERHSKIFGREVNGNSGTVSWTDHDLACRWLRDFGSHANLKRISSEVYGRGKDYLHGLLSGYLAGDGGLWKDSNNAAQIEASTSSRQLRDDLVSLCTLLGIMVTVSGGKKNGEGCLPLFSMRISTVYAEVLTPLFAYPDRQKKLEGILEMTACSSRKSMWYEQIPVDTKPAKKHLYACSGKPVDNFVYKSTSRGFVAKKRISTYSGRPGQLGRSDILWDKIISIQEIPHQDHVYDFSVDKAEAFAVANGLLVHNTQFSLMATVKPGMEVKEGDILAHSNFTDPKTGAFNMGQNLKVAILPGPRNANSFEDALIFSEDAAKRLATSRLYNFDQDSKNGVSVNKNKYIAAFPSAFTKDQIETIDDNGVVKVGTELHRGDPIILATGPKVLSAENAQLGKLSSVLKNAITDKAQTWNHDWPGTVTDIVTGASGAKVLIKSEPPLKVGDKASGRFALKGVTGTILSMDKMPRDAVTNEPYDMLVNPMGFLSRIAPGQLMELALGKVAKKTGQQVRIPQLPPKEGWLNWTRKQLADAGVSETADVFDPQTGRTLKGIGDGYMYVQAMHHLAEKKYSARGLEGGYTQDQQPAKGGETGAKKISGFDTNALLSHGATEVLKDAMTVRGTRNEEYWRKLRLGLTIPEPGVPFIYEKFLNNLKAGGINVVEKGDITSILPQTDADIEKLAEGRIIDSSQMVDANFDPVSGGLFDLGKTGGMGGMRWSMIELAEPIPNPIMEEPVRRVLNLTIKGLSDVIAGREKLNGKTGGAAIMDALANINVDSMIAQARSDIKIKRGSTRDNAVKILGYLTAAKDMNMSPKDWMISKVPVLPPAFRPISKAGDVALIPDTNELYKELLETKHNYEILRQDLPESALTDERLNVYKAVKAAFGLGNSITTEGQAKNLKGPIRQVIGSVPKWGQFQSKVVAKNQDLVGRSVTVPDKNLSMDQVGIPEDMAWTMYRPFVTRKLVHRGYSPVDVEKMIEDRTPTARHILDDVMQEKPILMDRAPTWHKFNIMAFKPFIVEGKEIRVCPMIDSGFNMDHDGDFSNSPYVTTFISDKIVENRPLTSEEDLCYNPTIIKPLIVGRSMKKESVVINGQNTPGVVVNLRWDEFPHYDNPTVNRHPNANFYLVPEGVCVRAYDEQKQQLVWAPVKYWSHHGVNEKLEVVTVELSSGRQILTDDDPRGVYGIDPETLTFGRWRPSESVGKFVPRCIKDSHQNETITVVETEYTNRERPIYDMPLDRLSGWFMGAMVGDGWNTRDHDISTGICFCFDKKYNDLGDAYRKAVCHALFGDSEPHMHENVQLKVNDAARYGDAMKININSSAAGRFIDATIGHGAENKHLPPFWQNAPREFKLGLFEGLLDTDGTLAIVQAKAKKNPQLMCNYSTVSMTLAAEVQYLCRTLGVDSKLTAQKTPAGGRCWQLSISTKNLKSLGLDLKSPHKAKALAEAEIQPDTAAGGRKYMIPVPKNELKRVSSLLLALDRAAYATLNRTGKLGYAPTTIADKIARILKATPELQTDAWKRWMELYENLDSVVWERVEGFTNTGMFEEGFDLTVPGYETFMNAEGIILSNTVNIHVPASDKASKEALEKMLPSKNLFSLTDMASVRYKPEKEQVSGLWALTSGILENKKPIVFKSKKEAILAYRNGEIGPNDPIELQS